MDSLEAISVALNTTKAREAHSPIWGVLVRDNLPTPPQSVIDTHKVAIAMDLHL